MTAEEIISTTRNNSSDKFQQSLTDLLSFKLGADARDINLNIRTEVIEKLLLDFSIEDIYLIRTLFTEEMKCEKVTGRHDNLYQLCFYLFQLRQLEDCFILYDAKFNASNFDVGAMLDREMITVGHEISKVIEYVEARFNKEPDLKSRYEGILEELNDLIASSDYDSIDDYDLFIRGYFFGHENVI